ncbi:hypothetical protein F2Q70_00013862 [Brassica cretica]|uniref:Uncharacterized protein n=1 Tax=Brassica cretica TaxID=69181 RepID=A0A8S9MEB3_BRACR|nr:hypothetical protein F2Q70_00013862 [Brassica cretica]
MRKRILVIDGWMMQVVDGRLVDGQYSYSPEDNIFDQRQFLYNSKWPYQFKKIDEIVDGLNGDSVAFPREEGSSGKEVGVVAANSGDPSAANSIFKFLIEKLTKEPSTRRQFLYNSKWPYQFKKIDEIVDGLNGDSVAFPREEGSSGKEVGVVAANSGDPSADL